MKRVALAALCLLASLPLLAAEEPPKNVKLLTGLSSLEIQRTMNLMRGSLGVHCDFCHVVKDGKWDWASDEKPEKKTGREMIQLVMNINRDQFHGRPIVSCNTCHRGAIHPVSMPTMPQPQPPFPTPEPDRKSYPKAAELAAKYVAAIGGEKAAAKIAGAKTVVLKGTRETPDGKAAPIEEEVVRPDRFRAVLTTPEGPVEQVVTGDTGWRRTKAGTQPLQQRDIENVHDIAAAFAPFDPAVITDKARVVNKEKVGDRDAWIVAVQTGEHSYQRLFFDAANGLLLRRIILTDGPVGRMPRQTDFDDYRDVDGVKLPYTVRVSLVDPWSGSTRKFTSIALDGAVDEKLFAAPQ